MPPPTARPLSWRVALLLFGSGMCALIYQTAWLRELRLVFGMSTEASAAVLAIFMGGLGAGGLLLGRYADRHRNPLALYGFLELGIALTTALTPSLIGLVRSTYVALGGTESLGTSVGTLVRLALSTAVLAGPTILMGGTLPAAIRAVESADDAGRSRIGLLYALNTLGAVTGAASATFILFEWFGVRSLLYMACAVNALVALVAIRLSHTTAVEAPPAEAETAPAEPPAAPPAFTLVAAAVVGLVFLLMELVWYRLLSPLLGGTMYTFGLILAVALAGIGLGSALFSTYQRWFRSAVVAFAVTCALEALFLAIPFALGDRLAFMSLALRPAGDFGFVAQVLSWSLVVGVVVFPPAFIAGIQFPVLIALLGRGERDVGRHVGLAYAFNTGGSIVGSLAGGFGAMPLLGAVGCWRLAAVLLLVMAAVALAVALRGRAGAGLGPAFATLTIGLSAVLLLADGPTAAWRHSGIGAGRSRFGVDSPNALTAWVHEQRRRVFWEADGVESGVAVLAEDGYAFAVNGKVDGNAIGDAGTQVMLGMIGALLHGEPKTAFVVGLGTGSTAGWLAALPTIDHVDVAELEPVITHVAELCAPVNHDAMANPKLRLHLGDAREHLLTSAERYDLIASEPSNPYRAGISSLFTVELYEAAKSRLTERGIFLQWLQAYDIDATTVRTVLATIGTVFESVEIWRTMYGDFVLVASAAPITHDVAALRARLAQEPMRTAVEKAWRATDLEGVYSRFVARAELVKAIVAKADGAVSTDDHNLVEFSFAQSLSRAGNIGIERVRTTAVARGEAMPTFVNGTLDAETVAYERVLASIAEDISPPSPESLGLSPEGQVRTAALVEFKQGNLDRVAALWQRQPAPPTRIMELTALGEALAEVGDAAAGALADRLAAFSPVEAHVIRARLAFRQSRAADAASALEAAFVTYRTNPWPYRGTVRRAFQLAIDVGATDPALGKRLYTAVAQPFAVGALEENRAMTALVLALNADAPGLCADALAPMEPHIPWTEYVLGARYRCYSAHQDPRAEAAKEDLARFLAAVPTPFEDGLLATE